MAWVDRASTSGYLYPRQLLRWRGYDPETLFGEERFVGDHVKAIEAVVTGAADVAAVAAAFVDAGTFQRSLGTEGLTVIAKTARIPLDAVVARTDLDRDLVMRLQRALVTLDEAPESRVLERDWGIGGFVVAGATHYDVVEAALAEERAR
jgi:phosphonate transport system substrate-binding protein